MSRFGITPTQFYWEFTPAELHYAFRDFEQNRDVVTRMICSTLRMVAVIIYNTAFGREKKDQITDPKRLWQFGWETEAEVKRQDLSEMKAALRGIAWNLGSTSKTKEKEKDAR